MRKILYRSVLIISIFYLLYILLFIGKFNYNLSSTIELSERHLGQFEGTLPHNLVVQVNSEGYDGQFYYMMALDPSLEKVHIESYFLQRILYPLLASILSFGIASIIPFSLLLLNYASIILSSYLLMLIIKKYQANLNLVLLWALNVGFLICVIRNLTEPLMILFVVMAIYFMEEQKYSISMIALALAILTKESVLLLYVSLLLYFLIKLEFNKLKLYLLAIIPFLIWEIMLIFKTGTIPFLNSSAHIGIPFLGSLEYLFNIPPFIAKYFISNFSLRNFLSFDYLRPIYKISSSLPVLVFSLIQLVIVIMVFLKDKKITMYTFLLLLQMGTFFSLSEQQFSYLEIDGFGRYGLLIFLFSILYYIEKKEKYNRFLKILSIALIALSLFMSIAYSIKKIIRFHPDYYIS